MSVSAANIDKEIIASVSQFVKYLASLGIDVKDIDSSHFMEIYQDRRAFKPTRDTFLHICEFLNWYEIIRFSTLCRKYASDYYPPAWDIIHRRKFPISITRPLTHTALRIALSLECYYRDLAYHKPLYKQDWLRIHESEQTMECCNARIKLMVDDPYNDDLMIAKSHLSISEDIRYSTISNASPILVKFLKTFQFNSKNDKYGNKYYTIKPKIDTRVYGIDPVTDPDKSYIKTQWVTGRYTDDREYYPDRPQPIDDEFGYEVTPGGSCVFRYRRRPSYC
jgi:hypothetical protein